MLSYEQELKQTYAASRSRLMAGKAPPKPFDRSKWADIFAPRKPMGPLRGKALFTAAIVELGPIDLPTNLPNWKRIVIEVARKHGVSFNDIVSGRRQRETVHARHEVFWRLKMETAWSLPQIGNRIGDKDHTTVLHGIRMHAKRMAEEGLVG